MSTCTDGPRTGRIGCGATYGGESQHCVARVAWSQHPDGLAHITASLSVIDYCWQKGKGDRMADPATLGLVQDATGRWRKPMGDARRARLAQIRQETCHASAQGRVNGPGAPMTQEGAR